MTETRNYYTSNNRAHSYTDHSTFGGYVYEYDFNGYVSMSIIADRIMTDMSFDRQCKMNAANRNRKENYKKESGINK